VGRNRIAPTAGPQPYTAFVRQHLDVLDEMASTGSINLVDSLKTIDSIAAATNRMLGATIAIFRAEGRTWKDIGDELGITRQAAQQRFGPHQRAWEEELRQHEDDDDV
jgi:hypothetical protein